MHNGKSLKPMQLTALKLIAMGTPANQVAERLEVSAMTVYRWQRLPAFQEKLGCISSSGLQEIATKLNAASLTAVETLQEVLCDISQPPAIKVKAALGVLNAMASVNNALEKGLQHRVADFPLQDRFNGPAFTFDSSGERITAGDVGESMSAVIGI